MRNQYQTMSLPSKLHRSLHNQLYARQLLNVGTGKNEENNQELVLRQINFAPYLSEILSYCKARLGYITLLDVSCGVLDSSTIATICKHFYQLQTLHAKSCGLCESLDNVKWPDKLQELDLSRNRLSSCPRGIFKLMHLEFINLSGNLISVIPTELLELPQLKKCQFINNPLSNVPKDICREGVVKLRCFFSVEALPMVQSAPYEDKKCKHFGAMSLRRRAHSNSECYPDLRRHLLRCQSSFESDYGSYQASRSPGSTSSNDVDFSEYSDCDSQTSPVSVEVCARPQLPVMMYLPAGYKRSHGNNLCQVYLPENYSEEIEVTIVKDLSMYPILRENELLVTPVVRITPHGLKFGSEPAMIVLPHCSRRSGSNLARYVPICSNTSNSQAPDWVQLDSCTNCIIDDEHVLFSTFHFSLFAVIFILSYPSSSMILHPHMGGTLLVPELPGFQLHVPNNSVSHLNKEVTISSTVHFCDKTYNASDIYAPASACIKLEPHGLQFNFPVEVTVPIPDYPAISHHFPGAKLELWTSANTACHNDIPRRWELMNEVDILVEDLGSNEYKFARFKIDHFSWYEILYKICASSLQTLGLGASYVYSQLPSRMRYIFVRYQAFVSNPHDLTFGLLVAIFKFGDPLTGLSNYPLLVADSGTKRVALHIGYLHVRLTGHFSPTQGVGENLEREGRIIDFTGEDFCERFEFALQLMPSVSLPLQSGQLLGQLHLIQQGRSLSCNLMIPPSTAGTPILSSNRNFPAFDEFTPPRSPEPQVSNAREPPHYEVFKSNDEYSRTLGKRRRSLSRDDSTMSHSPSPSTSSAKRRILMSEDELTDKDLLSISLKCGSKYLELGLHLGLDYQTITNRVSRHEGRGEHLKAFEVLQEWRGRGFSFSVLAHALEKVGLHQLALRYCYNEVPG